MLGAIVNAKLVECFIHFVCISFTYTPAFIYGITIYLLPLPLRRISSMGSTLTCKCLPHLIDLASFLYRDVLPVTIMDFI